MPRTGPFGHKTTLIIGIDNRLCHTFRNLRIEQREHRMNCTERIPKTIVGIHIAIVYITVIRTIINRISLRIKFIKLTWKEQCTIQTRIESTELIIRTAFGFYTPQIIIPLFAGFSTDQLNVSICHFTIEVDSSLFGTDERRSCADGQLFSCRNVELQISTTVISCHMSLLMQQCITIVNPISSHRVTEFNHKIVSEIIRHSSIIVT